LGDDLAGRLVRRHDVDREREPSWLSWVCAWDRDRPIRYGRDTFSVFDPSETLQLTMDPLASVVPAAGSWATTVPLGAEPGTVFCVLVRPSCVSCAWATSARVSTASLDGRELPDVNRQTAYAATDLSSERRTPQPSARSSRTLPHAGEMAPTGSVVELHFAKGAASTEVPDVR
jgi:hypothetical protein